MELLEEMTSIFGASGKNLCKNLRIFEYAWGISSENYKCLTTDL